MAVVIANLGNSDVQIRKEIGTEEQKDKKHEIIPKTIIYENLLNDTDDQPYFPLMESIEKYLLVKQEQLNYLILFKTQQNNEAFSDSDTSIDFQIIELALSKNKIFSQFNPRIIGCTIHESPHSYDTMYSHYHKEMDALIASLEQDSCDFSQTFYISLTGGISACNFALLHSLYDRKEFRNNKQFIYSPRPEKEGEQPAAVEVHVDSYLNAKELIKSCGELLNGQHYGQVKDLLSMLELLQTDRENVNYFLDALLSMKNIQYSRSVETLNRVKLEDEFRINSFFRNAFAQVKQLSQGIVAIKKCDHKWLRHPDVKRLLEAQYWKVFEAFRLEQYNDWATLIITFYDNLLRMRAIELIGVDKLNGDIENLSAVIQRLGKTTEYRYLQGDGFVQEKYPYPNYATFQTILKAHASNSLLDNNNKWVEQLNKIRKARNDLIHLFGGLSQDVIEKTFHPVQWDAGLKKLLKQEFHFEYCRKPTPFDS